MEPMLNIALRAARKAGNIIARATEDLERLEVSRKSVNDFVSEVDLAAEREIIYHIHKAHPEHSILAEESGETKGTDPDHRWIIDPLDGTTNFIRGIPHFAVSIACEYRGVIEHAVVLDPIRREEFTASRGKGAQLNGRRLRVSQLKSLDDAILGTGIPFKEEQQQHLSAYMQSLEQLAGKTAGIRQDGAASLNLAYVAAGRLDGYWELGLAPWDLAAGVLLIREAGGLIGDLSGGPNYMDSGNIACGNPKVFKSLVQTTAPLLGAVR
ncbi:MAG: myo-inositol-1(or 4)-monophosphatase [Halieaceae bacterium]|jgi:myo-inositol-1(or 4)-monophosphatase